MAAKDGSGILSKSHAQLASPLVALQSPFDHLQPLAATRGVPPTRAVRAVRAMQLRLSASFNYHFLGSFWQPQYEIVNILNESDEHALQRLEQFMRPEENGTCLKCEGIFLQRLRARLADPPALSALERVQVVREIVDSLASDPLIASMHTVETLHAHFRAGAARSIDRRKQLPTRLVASQSLVRWSKLHKVNLGKKWRPAPSIRQKILKTKRVKEQVSTRILTGHDMYVQEANRQRQRRRR